MALKSSKDKGNHAYPCSHHGSGFGINYVCGMVLNGVQES